MNDPIPSILVTGVAGNLGGRLLPLLSNFRVVGVDLPGKESQPDGEIRPLDLGRESSCVALVRLLRESRAEAVVHLAFAAEAECRSTAEWDRMWQANVAGTARVMEAITEVNRHGGNIRKFICLSSAAVYGPETEPLVDEDAPLDARTLSYAMLKAEADAVVRFRTNTMGKCSTYLLRPHAMTGASVKNQLVNAIRERGLGKSKLAARMRRKNKGLPLLLPTGKSSPQKLFQFVHVDDMARLIAWLLDKHSPEAGELLTLNVAGAGSPVSIAKCAEIAKVRIVQLPSRWLCTKVLTKLWKSGTSAVPPDAFGYLAGSCTTSTQRLKRLLGNDYPQVIRYSNEAALRDSLEAATSAVTEAVVAVKGPMEAQPARTN